MLCHRRACSDTVTQSNTIMNTFLQFPCGPSKLRYEPSDKRYSYQRKTTEMEPLLNKTYWLQRHWNNCEVWLTEEKYNRVRDAQYCTQTGRCPLLTFYLPHFVFCFTSCMSFSPFVLRTCTLFWGFNFSSLLSFIPFLICRLVSFFFLSLYYDFSTLPLSLSLSFLSAFISFLYLSFSLIYIFLFLPFLVFSFF